jgi:hypothetical protein
MTTENTQQTKKVVDIVHNILDAKKEAPAGFRVDEEGNFIRKEGIKQYELDRDSLVNELVLECAVIADELQALRHSLKTKIQSYVNDMFKEYDKKLGGKKGNVTLLSFDKKLKVERSIQQRETTNERILIAKNLVDECLKKWAKGANKNLQVVVQRHFKTDGKGSYNVKLLKQLLGYKMPSQDDDWDNAMLELACCIEQDQTAIYYRAYYRDESGNYNNIPLDIANVC